MNFRNTDRITGSGNGGEVVRFVHLIGNHGKIGLSLVQGFSDALVTLWCHAPSTQVVNGLAIVYKHFIYCTEESCAVIH